MAGRWKIESYQDVDTYSPDNKGTRDITTYVSGNATVEFKEDGSYALSGTPLLRYVGLENNDTILILSLPFPISETGTYTVVGNRLNLTISDSTTSPVTVIEYSGTHSIDGSLLSVNLVGMSTEELNGVMVTTTTTNTSTYRKL